MWFSKISIQEIKSKALDEPPMGEKEKKKKEAIAKKKSSHCQHCGKYCLDLTLLDQHLKMYHQIDEHIKKICCQLCGKLYTKAAPLRQHIKLFHKQWVKQKRDCQLCAKHFQTPETYLDHLSTRCNTNWMHHSWSKIGKDAKARVNL